MHTIDMLTCSTRISIYLEHSTRSESNGNSNTKCSLRFITLIIWFYWKIENMASVTDVNRLKNVENEEKPVKQRHFLE